MRIALSLERSLALVLVLSVSTIGLPAAASPASAAISGKLLRAAGGSPLAGAVVRVALRADTRVFQSARADERGNYALGSLPPGTYDVAVEADGGLYVVNGPLALQPGERRSMSLSVLAKQDEPAPTPPTPPAEPPEPKEPKPEEPKDKPKETEPKETKDKAKGSKAAAKGGFFHSPWGGAILVLGSAAVIGAVVASSDNDDPASASPSK